MNLVRTAANKHGVQSACHRTSYPIISIIMYILSSCFPFPLQTWSVPPVSGGNAAEERAGRPCPGALMESLRLRWQEVKGQLHAAAAVAPTNRSTVMGWEVCVCVCVCECV